MISHPSKHGETLFLLSTLHVGGSERKTVRLANALGQAGYAVTLAWLNEPNELQSEILPPVKQLSLSRRGKFDLRVVFDLGRYIDAHGIGQLITVNLYPLLYGFFARWAARTRPVLTAAVNTTDFLGRNDSRHMAVYGPLLRRVDGIVFGCAHQMDSWIVRFSLPQDRSHVVYNGVDGNWFAPSSDRLATLEWRRARGIDDHDIVVGTIGQLRPEKQQDDLIAAIARLRARGYPVTAVIVGAGSQAQRLSEAVSALGIDKYVVFTGQLTDVRPVLQAFDIFALTSVAIETFSNAALEAMACACPVVLSDIGGAREMIADGVNGLIYPPGNVDELTGSLARLISDPVFRNDLAQRARSTVLQRFSFLSMVCEYEKLLGMQGEHCTGKL